MIKKEEHLKKKNIKKVINNTILQNKYKKYKINIHIYKLNKG